MSRRLLLVLPAALGLLASDLGAQSCAPARTALVLSGGGAKGFAHIGVIEIMDSLGLRPDLVVGTSIGAIVGAMYASGMSGRQIDSTLHSRPIGGMIRQYAPRVSSALGLLRPLAVWDKGEDGYVLQSGAVREGEFSALLSSLLLRGNLIARGDFDSLPLPFRAVATDVATRAPIVLAGGDLAQDVRASAAVPVVLRPVLIGGHWLLDGGIAENVPVEVARNLGAQRSWISLLPFEPPNPKTFDDPLTITTVLLNSLFMQDSLGPRRGDVRIENATTGFATLSFGRATTDSLIEIGRAGARAAFAGATCLRPLAAAHRSPPLPTRVNQVGFAGVRIVDGDLVLDELGVQAGDALNVGKLDAGITAIGRNERYRAIWLNPTGSGDSVSLHMQLTPAPQSSFGGGVAFDQFMSGRLWFGGIDRTLLKGDAEGVGIARVGTYEQDLDLFVRRLAQVKTRYVPFTVEGQFKHENVRRFAGDSELPATETHELIGFIGLKQDARTDAWSGEVGLDTRAWRDSTHGSHGTFGVRASIFRAATEYEVGSIVELLAFRDYQRGRFDISRRWGLAGHIDLRARLRGGWGNRLPLQETFRLGGDDGFAGFRIGDLRGSQEAFASLLLRKPINSLLIARVEVMSGTVANGYGVLNRVSNTTNGEVLGGVRAGLEVPTLMGPIRVEEGVANTGQRAIFIRVGTWF